MGHSLGDRRSVASHAERLTLKSIFAKLSYKTPIQNA